MSTSLAFLPQRTENKTKKNLRMKLPPPPNHTHSLSLSHTLSHSTTMESSSSCLIGNLSSSTRTKAMEELNHGRGITKRFLLSLTNPTSSFRRSSDLAEEILGSFDRTISILSSSTDCVDEVISQVPALDTRDDVSSHGGNNGPKSEDSIQNSKSTSPVKDRRGCYKRRKTSETWIKELPDLVDDGYAWRKYGQKSILNATYPRSYFRCTHKYEQECQATKYEQKIQEDPPIYRTTYHGHHTCNTLLRSTPQIILDSTVSKSSMLLSFESAQPPVLKHDHYMSTSSTVVNPSPCSLREKENSQPASSSDYNFLSPDDLTVLGSTGGGGPIGGGTDSSSVSDLGDVISSTMYSCTESAHSTVGMDMINEGSIDFDDVFLQFQFEELN